MPVDFKRPGGLIWAAVRFATFTIGFSILIGMPGAKLFGVPGRVALVVMGAGIGAVATTLATRLVIQDVWRKDDGKYVPSNYPVATVTRHDKLPP